MSQRKLSLPAALLRHLLLLTGAAVMLTPFVWMVSVSLKPPQEVFQGELHLLPQGEWHAWENYTLAFTAHPLTRYILNGVFVTAAIFLCQILVAIPCAYALAKLEFRGRKLVFLMVLGCLLIPPQVPAIPLYVAFFKIGIVDSYAGLIMPFTISVFGIFLMRQFFKSIPDDLVDAARLDGMSELAICWRVMVPMAVPAVVAFGIFSVVAHWNDFFWPLIVVNSQEHFTPPLGVMAFRNDEAGNNYGAIMAAATIIIAPLVLAFLLAQRRFIEGITFTGLKG